MRPQVVCESLLDLIVKFAVVSNLKEITALLRIVRRIQRIALPLAALITAVQRVERTDLCLRVLLLREALQQEEAEPAA